MWSQLSLSEFLTSNGTSMEGANDDAFLHPGSAQILSMSDDGSLPTCLEIWDTLGRRKSLR